MKTFGYVLIIGILVAAGIYYGLPDKGNNLLSTIIGNDTAQDDDDGDDELRVGDVEHRPAHDRLSVALSAETQKIAGIKTVSAQSITFNAEDKAHASIIDIGHLVDLRSRVRNVRAALKISRTRVNSAVTSLSGLQKLNAETTTVSQRELQRAQAALAEQRAIFSAEQIKLDNIRTEMLQRWNSTITELALQDSSELINRLLNQQEHLILLALRPEQRLSSGTAFVYVNHSDERHTARRAYVVSAAPFSDLNLRGETYFLRAPSEQLRIGMQLHAWLPGTGFSGTGIEIPDSAIVWYAGKPWAYVQLNEFTFGRRSLPEARRTDHGWLVGENFATGDRIVISGAQTLLSEEFKWAIPDEDDD